MSFPLASEAVTIEAVLQRLEDWIESEQFLGWEPHDALNSPILKRLAYGNRLLSVAYVQLLRRSPWNLRPLLGIRKGYSAKAIGLFLESYSRKVSAQPDADTLQQVQFLSNWLVENALTGYSGCCWGYHFDWPNRGFFAPAGTPTIVNTAYVALAFLAAEPILRGQRLLLHDESQAGGDRSRSADALSIARSACEFILKDLNILRHSADEVCFSYTPLDQRFVHNASLMGAWLLGAVYQRTAEPKLAEYAAKAARFTVARQRTDGSWPYGMETRDKWVDNFHTGFVLLALRETARYLDTHEFETATQAGYRFWKEQMLLKGYIPKYYPDSTYPIDVHCVAQAILTFLEFADVDPTALSRATQLCVWAAENLQDAEGFFHYQIHPFYRIRIPYMRWGQAWMHLALTKLVNSLRGTNQLVAEVRA
jgi:hypothetical protein